MKTVSVEVLTRESFSEFGSFRDMLNPMSEKLGAPGMWPECISLHRRGLIRTDRIITHRLSLANFVEAIEISRTRRDGAIKVLLTP
jgi:threonine dehydrogenase-like Zn-dependent dehydrogenase